MSFIRLLSHVAMYFFLSQLPSLTVLSFLLFLVWSYFPFPFFSFLEFYSELCPLLFFSTLISSLLLVLLISYLVFLLLSSLSHRRCFGNFVLFLLVLFVWPICRCCYLWYYGIVSMSHNLFFVLLAILLSQLLVQYEVL